MAADITPEHDGKLQMLLATDSISEGRNLQDCDCLVNYDIHWTPCGWCSGSDELTVSAAEMTKFSSSVSGPTLTSILTSI